MKSILNKKLAGINNWADFRGFSLLFNNPGDSYKLLKNNLLILNNRKSEIKSILYTELHNKLIDILPTFPNHANLFCPLPLRSYHVTFWDGVNSGNSEKLNSGSFELQFQYFNQFPGSFKLMHEFIILINDYLLSINFCMKTGIDFKFDKLTNWGGEVLVARLKAANIRSDNILREIEKRGNQLTKKYKNKYGDIFNDREDGYSPHITLGYFANKYYGKLIGENLLSQWNTEFEKKVSNTTIHFSNISLYGFTNMVTFFK